MRRVLGARCWVLVLSLGACSRAQNAPPTTHHPLPTLTEQSSGTTALLQAVSAVNERVVWVSGHRATWARTTDGGATWQAGAMTGPDSVLQFRDVHAVSADVAYLLAAGPGDRSRIYKTTNGGASWTLQFMNRDTSAFYDCFDFWDANRGVAVSDEVNGRMPLLLTSDGGVHWAQGMLPPALRGEGAFAASGTCLVARRGGHAWIGSTAARVYHSGDYGVSWTVVTTPVTTGTATGIASLSFRDDRFGAALGGSIGQPDSMTDNVAITNDGGATWTLADRPPFAGAVYGSAFAPGSSMLTAVSPRGLAVSDAGRAWSVLSANAYWAIGFGSPRVGWAVGPGGRITRLDVPR